MPVNVVEKSGEGLSRVYGVTVPAGELATRLTARIEEMRPQMNVKGFRPGKVPAAHVKKMYGRQLMGEVVQAAFDEGQTQAMEQAGARPAAQPEVKFDSDMDKVMKGEADLAFDLDVELMPDFEPTDVSTIALKRPVYTATDEEVDAQLKELADANRTYETKVGKTAKSAVKADDGDMVVADFVGRIDGETFEGGSAEGAEIVIGSGRFIPGFEEQLKGAKAGQTVTVKVSFPDDYGVDALKGKPAEFETTLKEIRAPAAGGAPDDAFAERIGMPSLEALRDAIRGQLQGQYAGASRFKAKRALLDVLDERHDFPLPPRMVEAEFATIWRQVEQEREAGELSDEDKAKDEDTLRAEYRKIAERRVRLGLVLAEIGQRAQVQVSDQELQGALIAEARKFPGQEREVIEYFRQNPQAAAQLRAPVFEEKVVDLILSQAQVEDQQVSKETLFEEDEMPEGYGEG